MRKAIVVVLAVIGLLFCGSAYADLNDGLVAYYPFNGNANDESGNGNHGSEHGAVSYFSGKNAQAVLFDGKSAYIEVPYSNEFSLSEWTISTYVQVNNFPYSSGLIFGMTENSNGRYNYSIILRKNGSVSAQYETANSDFDHTLYSQSLKLNEWFHVVSTRSSSGDHKLYINGTLEESGSWVDTPIKNTEPLIMGGIMTNTQDYLDIFLDETRLYNRVLSESEIQQLYNETDSDCPDVCTQAELDAKYNEGYNDGVATCEGCTQTQLDEKYDEGKQYCIDHPEECGIEVDGDYQEGYDKGYQSGLAECSNSSCSPVKLSSDLNMHIPELTYETLLGSMNLWVDMEFVGENNDGDLLWKLIDLGEKK